MTDDDPEVVDVMLYYFYHFDYDDAKEGSSVQPIILDLHLFVIADKYFIKPLQEMAKDKFLYRANSEWGSTAFADAVQDIYAMEAESATMLKWIVLDIVKEHAAELFGDKGCSYFQDIAETTPKFLLTTARTSPVERRQSKEFHARET